MERVILASASPRRKELLEKAGIIFCVMPSEAEEKVTCHDPEDVVKELSMLKAKATCKLLPKEKIEENQIVIGADTIVSYENQILGKPENQEAAVQMLSMLQGNTHQVFTGVTACIWKNGKWSSHSFAECTDVSFYPVSEDEIHQYVQSGEPMDKAGSYGIQGSFFVHVKGIHGDYNNVVGLPVARLLYEMKKIGIDLKGTK